MGGIIQPGHLLARASLKARKSAGFLTIYIFYLFGSSPRIMYVTYFVKPDVLVAESTILRLIFFSSVKIHILGTKTVLRS